MNQKKIQIGISSPTYNESKNIDKFIKNISRLNKYYSVCICFVDDGSTDDTVEKIKSYKRLIKNIYLIERKKISKRTQVYSAYHAGLKYLFKNTDTAFYAQIDSDNVCGFNDIKNSFDYLSKNNNIKFIKLSKYLNNSKDERSIIRSILSKIYTKSCRYLFDSDISDYSTGIRFYSKDLLMKMINRNKSFLSPIGLLDDLLWIIRNKIKVIELSFKIKKRIHGNSFLNLKEFLLLSFEFVICICKHKFKND